ncbi:MAG: hypothetical protein WBI28_00665 [Candidatus Omnitrophota bacterium]
MEFDELREQIKVINLDNLRLDCDNHFEAVISRSGLDKLIERLERFFGSAVWPSKNRLSVKMQEAVNGFGGIMVGQTLYFRNDGNDIVFAMLWPWQDGQRTTLKIIKK